MASTISVRARLETAFALALLVGLGFPSTVFANAREDPEVRRVRDAAWRADEDTRLFARAICAGLGGAIVWVAIGIARNGVGLGGGLRRVTGPWAWAVAAVLGVLGSAIAVVGVLYVSAVLSWL